MVDPTITSDHSRSALRSLAPNYLPEQHGTYLKRLQAAVEQPNNRNIALTGSYGTGKSSVLDQFCRERESDTLRLSISTLGGGNDDTTLTNRLQKEVVKQLLYSAEWTTLRNSRFKRIRSLSKGQAALEAAGATGVVGLLLALTGNLPAVVGTEGDRHTFTRIVAWLAVAGATALIAMVLRLATFDRFVVSTVGGAVTLKEDTSTYFDEYLDEIVHYFDSTDIRTVVFEDLDRFDNPQIFEALRELNSLLNNTPRRRTDGVSLRFVYAVKDSLFEQLGKTSPRQAEPTDTSQAAESLLPESVRAEDAAAAETERANRTKFFDLVIPIVPFISHRNARELLSDLLAEAEIRGVDRALVDIVARHTTDMRLLVNLCNEYLVFAERLLDSDRVAPDLTPSHLFALVAYKMFHMEDFERIARRSSLLDDLYDESRDIVHRAVENRRRRLRQLSDDRVRGSDHARAARAATAGARMSAVARTVKQAADQLQSWGDQTTLRFQVEGTDHDESAIELAAFWVAAAKSGTVTISEYRPNNTHRKLVAVADDRLRALVPEASDASGWGEVDERAVREEVDSLVAEIAKFRGAGFDDLVRLSDAFAEALNVRLASEMSRELVREGYLTRHFATYAAQFYGDFVGVDVVTFIMQTVETNSVDMEYAFSTPGAVGNLLSETDAGFTRSLSALNIEVLDHLLAEDDPRRDDVARQIMDRDHEHTWAFLSAYLNDGEAPEALVARLAALGWPPLLQYLAESPTLAHASRARLLDAALSAPALIGEMIANDAVQGLVADRYVEMSSFTGTDDAAVLVTVAGLIEKLDWDVPDLAPLSGPLRDMVIERSRYEVTAGNLHVAAAGTDISLDTIIDHPTTYWHVLGSSSRYLDAVNEDSRTPFAIERQATLVRVIEDVEGEWSESEVAAVLNASAEAASLADVRDAPECYWDAIADAGLLEASLGNVIAFLDRDGAITGALGGLLLRAHAIAAPEGESDEDQEAKTRVAVALLNGFDHIPRLEDRVELASTLMPLSALPAENIEATDATLLASLLSAELVEDSLDVLMALRPSTWEGIDAALEASATADQFVTPELIEGYVGHVLASSPHKQRFGAMILADLHSFVPVDDAVALERAGEYAVESGTRLPMDQVHRVARVTGDVKLIVRLIHDHHLSETPSALAAALSELGDPYDRPGRGGAHFDVPYTTEFRSVFDRLAEGGLCDTRKRRGIEKLRVTPGP